MSHIYPELIANQSLITEVIRVEEEKFVATLDTGLNLVEKLISEASAQRREGLTSEEVFRLYDTYGFPPELTAEIAREKGLSIDWEGFRSEMDKQRERARATRKFASDSGYSKEEAKVEYKPEPTEFLGYDSLESHSKINYLLDQDSGIAISRAEKGKLVAIVLHKTPFYAEMGGQVGDVGKITCPSGWADITKTIWSPFGKLTAGAIVHLGKVVEGSISVGDRVEAKVDSVRRLDIARNHTATHLLQAALRQTLGSRVYQKGSLVEPERFRFDFSQLAPVTEEELTKIQRQVNEWIRQDLKAEAKVLPYKEAITEDAIALFEEKYGEEVRMLEIGEPAISKELCGGTHVRSTGEIGIFLITSESSIGTGLHRIEAVTGRKAESVIESRLTALQSLAKEVESSLEEVPDKVKALIGELEAERKRVLSLERELSRKIVEDLLGRAEQVSGVTVLTAKVPALTMPVLREMGDILRDRLKSAVVVLATVYNGKPNFLAMVTPDLIAKGFNAGDIINQVAKVTGGGGGGKAAMAQAGGKDAAKIDEALKLVKSVIASKISSHLGK
jgi:alanyl-tRNA synthetase